MTKKKKINWLYYSIELLVVFIGVTAGFLLNNWREDNSNSKLEQKYLNGFYADLLSDKDDLDSLIQRTQIKTDGLLEVLKKADYDNNALTREMADEIIGEILFLEWFTPADDTYDDIINSGNLNLISDYRVKEAISSYYSLLNEVKNVEQFYLNHMNDYGFPIIYKNYHILKREFIDDKCYKSLEFTNMYLGIISFYQQNIKIYKQALENNLELVHEIEKIIKNGNE
ncbi:hypothetical protein [Draconibacterium mangrovi]|uniref:hypothetical protein n=1 Tax=Draconibacterium mangrovi TaxID=2697469 RepID=UPI0013D1A983|nr:hypothetical protein [Draconibacterium mangrovi]